MALDVGALVARLEIQGLAEFRRDMDRAENVFRDLGRQADRSTSGLGQGFQDARRDVTQLADSTSRSGTSMRQDLQRTEQTGRQSAQGMGNAFRTAFNGVGDNMRSELDSATQHAGTAGGAGGGDFVAAFGGRVASLGSKAGPIAAALVGIGGIGFIAGKTLADQVLQGFELQQNRGKTQAQFGLSPAQMAQVGTAAGNAYGNAWGESVNSNMNTAGLAMQAGLLDGNATAKDIQPVVEKLSILSDLMGTEIPETAKAAGQMVKTGLAKDSAEALDLLTVGQQKGLNLSGDLLDTVNEYGTQWRKLGIDGKTALGTISQMTKAGARDTDIAADALKEFSIRVVDGSDSTKDAYSSLGLDVNEASEAFGRGGDSALGMSRTVLLALSNVRDPIERNRLGLQLMGTQWEDLGGAVNNLDLSKAAASMGEVGGATQRAGDQMSGATGAITAAKNQISMAADGIKMKLAEAFAPAAIEGSAWVASHKEEIVTFFATAADGALALSQGLIQVGAWATDMTGTLVDAGASILDYFVIPVMNGVEQIGSVMSHLPGAAGELGAKLRDSAKESHESLGGTRDTLRNLADGYHAAGDGMRSFSDHISGVRSELQKTAEQSRTSTAAIAALTGQLVTLPDGKTITVKDNTPETRKNLTDLGFTVTTLPDGRLSVSAQTDSARAALAEITKPRTVDITANIDRILAATPASNADAPNLAQMTPQQRALFGRASGGRVGGNGGPRADDQLIWASSPEWVIQSKAAEHYGPAAMNAVNNGTAHILAYANGGPVGQPAGYGLPAGSTGGFPSWVTELGAQYGVKPSTYAGHQEGSRNEPGYAPNPQGLNRGIDWGGSTAQMQTFAEAMYARAQSDPAIEQIIWQNPQTGQKIGWHGRSPDTDGSYFASDYAGHTDHVHLRVAAQLGASAGAGAAGAPGPRTIPLVKNPDGTYTSSDPAWAALINRESGGNASIVQGINDVNSGGNEASGLFQIAKGTWAANGGAEFAATAGEADPEKQAIVAARIFDQSGGNPWGAGLAGRENEDALRAGITASVVPDPAAATSSSASGVQNVFVTGGRLDGATSSTDTPATPSAPSQSTPDTTKVTGIGPLPLRAYMNGGTIPGAGNEDTELIWAMPGEEVIRKGPAAKHRPLLKMINADKFAGGGTVGFGGYTKDTTDAMKPKNWYDWAALGVGGAMAVGSIAEPYINMATGKQVDLGNLSPTVDTGANSIPGTSAITQGLQTVVESINKQTEELVKAANEGKNIHVTVQSDNGIGGLNHHLKAAMGARGMGL